MFAIPGMFRSAALARILRQTLSRAAPHQEHQTLAHFAVAVITFRTANVTRLLLNVLRVMVQMTPVQQLVQRTNTETM